MHGNGSGIGIRPLDRISPFKAASKTHPNVSQGEIVTVELPVLASDFTDTIEDSSAALIDAICRYRINKWRPCGASYGTTNESLLDGNGNVATWREMAYANS